jgi:hypothetical protein
MSLSLFRNSRKSSDGEEMYKPSYVIIKKDNFPLNLQWAYSTNFFMSYYYRIFRLYGTYPITVYFLPPALFSPFFQLFLTLAYSFIFSPFVPITSSVSSFHSPFFFFTCLSISLFLCLSFLASCIHFLPNFMGIYYLCFPFPANVPFNFHS